MDKINRKKEEENTLSSDIISSFMINLLRNVKRMLEWKYCNYFKNLFFSFFLQLNWMAIVQIKADWIIDKKTTIYSSYFSYYYFLKKKSHSYGTTGVLSLTQRHLLHLARTSWQFHFNLINFKQFKGKLAVWKIFTCREYVLSFNCKCRLKIGN